jgi:acyl carrier protein
MPTYADIEKKILDYCCQEVNHRVTLEAKVRADLKFDELAIVELTLMAEEAAGVEVPDEKMNPWLEGPDPTIADIVRLVAEIAGIAPEAAPAPVGREVVLEVAEITYYPDPKGTASAAQAMMDLHRRATAEVPLLLAKNMPVGPTGYLDRLQPRGMSAPIMVGVDYDRRPFIAFRVILEDAQHYSAPRSGVVTAFQRYPSSGKPWTTGGDLSNHEVFGTGDTPSVACFRDLLDRGRHEAKLREYELGEPTGQMRTVVVRLDV